MKNANCPLCAEKLKTKKLNRLWNLKFCDNSDCYGFIERVRIECEHDYRYVYSMTKTGKKVYGKECIHCGDYKRIRKDLIPNINNLSLRRAKYFVDASRDMERFYLAQKARYDQKRVKILEQKRKDEKDEWFRQHSEYLKTDKWKSKRLRVLQRDNYLCQACLKNPATQVHHTTYKHWRNEPLFELVSVCNTCHNEITKMDRKNTS